MYLYDFWVANSSKYSHFMLRLWKIVVYGMTYYDDEEVWFYRNKRD